MYANLSSLESLQASHGCPATSVVSVFNVREAQIAAIEKQYVQVKEHPDDPQVRQKLDELLADEKDFWMPYARAEKGIGGDLAAEYMKYLFVCGGDAPAC